MVDLPFTTEQFLQVFREYNLAIWPMQVVAYVLGLVSIGLSVWWQSYANKVNSLILFGMWIWMGMAYHITFFSQINQAAFLFGAIFLLQGLLFAYFGFLRNELNFGYRNDAYGIIGAILIVYAMVIYPIIGAILGHTYPSSPVFGVAPCPTTIFTFGLLLWTRQHAPWWLLIIPGIWSVIGFTAAIKLGIREDIGLLVAGIIAISMLVYRNRTRDGLETAYG
ncbi:hypothetical protein SAMN05443144_106158 [Fodinibius roseus]|uniref:Uncharacterized protein n=1 Tax=Fodinibius roseus TaxID=1194090 RepID=A0A1M4ZWC1_9BACT|nr:DUF6064 family protein [Fodinibius roseus]SHF22359.1 hypothetical protein SAMN05443144_106158 [Fodinibius roseus]